MATQERVDLIIGKQTRKESETRKSMHTKVMRWVAAVALSGAVLLRPSTGDEALLQFVVSASAVLVMVQAGLAGRYVVAAAFTLVAVLFNPVVPVALVSQSFLWMYLSSLAMAGIFLTALKIRMRPRLSMASITVRTPGSESL